MADEYAFQASGVPQETIFDMQTRQFTWIPDNNQNSYPNGQILFDGAALSNSGRWIDPTQSYMVIPLVLSVQGSFPVGANNAGNIESRLARSSLSPSLRRERSS